MLTFISTVSLGFNPRSHEGSDTAQADKQNKWNAVSIHAPTKGATYIEEILPNDTVVSIHAPTKGATHVDIHLNCIVGFQSTLPRRERRQGIKLGVRPVCFNPRSHEGSDDYNTVLRRVVKVSIHAPTKGATGTGRQAK